MRKAIRLSKSDNSKKRLLLQSRKRRDAREAASEISAHMKTARIKEQDTIVRLPRINPNGVLTLAEANNSILYFVDSLYGKYPFDLSFYRRDKIQAGNNLMQQRLASRFIISAASELAELPDAKRHAAVTLVDSLNRYVRSDQLLDRHRFSLTSLERKLVSNMSAEDLDKLKVSFYGIREYFQRHQADYTNRELPADIRAFWHTVMHSLVNTEQFILTAKEA